MYIYEPPLYIFHTLPDVWYKCSVFTRMGKQGKCIHPKQPVILEENPSFLGAALIGHRIQTGNLLCFLRINVHVYIQRPEFSISTCLCLQVWSTCLPGGPDSLPGSAHDSSRCRFLPRAQGPAVLPASRAQYGAEEEHQHWRSLCGTGAGSVHMCIHLHECKVNEIMVNF